MTKDEAIDLLKMELGCRSKNMKKCFEVYGLECKGCGYCVDYDVLTEAIKTAIKALEAMDEDLIRRQDALNCFHAWIDKHGDVQEPDDMAEYRAIENLPAVMEGKE